MAIFSKKENTEKQEQQPAADKPAHMLGSSRAFAGIIVQPRISEKANHLVSANKYIFDVLNSANKIEVKKAVENAYKVKVTQVNMIKVKGKNRNYGRISGRTSDFKKAIVTLKKGDKIEGATETI